MDDTKLWQTIEEIKEALDKIAERQGATSRSVINLGSGLRLSEQHRREEDSDFSKMKLALLQLAAIVSQRDVSRMSGDQLAEHISLETASRARNILWARKRGEPDPLPPVPHTNAPLAVLTETSSGSQEIVPLQHLHRRKDDSVAIKTDKSGHARLEASIKMKTLIGWAAAAALGALHIWRTLSGH